MRKPTVSIEVTGYENQGYTAFLQGATKDANPWMRSFHGHGEWDDGWDQALRNVYGSEMPPMPIYTVKDVATVSMDPRGYRVSFWRLPAYYSQENAEYCAKTIRASNRLALVLPITPRDQIEIYGGAWDGFSPNPSTGSFVTVGDWRAA